MILLCVLYKRKGRLECECVSTMKKTDLNVELYNTFLEKKKKRSQKKNRAEAEKRYFSMQKVGGYSSSRAKTAETDGNFFIT